MNNKNIAIFRRYNGFGGVEKQILGLAKMLLDHNWNVMLISDKISPMSLEAERIGICVLILQKKSFIGRIIELYKICVNQHIFILQAHMFYESILCRSVKILLPELICTFRVHTYIDCSHISNLKKFMYHILARITDRLIDCYIPINKYNAEELYKRSHISNKKIIIIHNALNERVRTFKVTREYFENDDIKQLVMIANFVDFKGHDTLLSGVKILCDKGYFVKVRLIGGVPGQGTDLEDTKRLNIVRETIKQLHLENNVELYGISNNIPEAIKGFGIVVLPSDSEGTPNVLLEAMWLHKIVVASSVGGIPEFVIDRKTGFLHKSQSAEEFANAVIEVLKLSKERRMEILSNGYDIIQKEYLLTDIFKKMNRVYKNLLEERNEPKHKKNK